MMKSRVKLVAPVAAFFMMLAIGQLYVPASFAQPSPGGGAVLTTGNNQPINVNGSSTISGATIMSGAAIETPDQVGASLSVPNHFTLDISPGTNLTVIFDEAGIRVTVTKGCVVLHTKQGTTGEIDTPGGVKRSDGRKDARLDICEKPAGGGLTAGETIAIVAAIGGALALIPLLTGGGNPSSLAP